MRPQGNRIRFFSTQRFGFGAGLLLLACSACTSKPKPSAANFRSTSQTATSQTPPGNHFDGGTYCVQTLLQGPSPAQPLHFSNQIVESDLSDKTKDFQADYAGDNVDLVHRDRWLATDQDKQFFEDTKKFDDPKVITRTINNGIAEETVTNHATRSDAVSWRGVIVGIAQAGTPWNLFVNKPIVSLVGPDAVNGFDTLKYSVDTTRQDPSDKAAYLAFSHLQNYDIVGTAWVWKDSPCILQYNIDYSETGKDGKSRKTHYEGKITKK